MVDAIKKDAQVTPVKETEAKPEVKQAESLISQISKPEPVKQEQQVDVIADAKATLDQIKDPVAKKLLEEKIANLEKGYNQKYMTLAEEKKALEAERSKLNQPWTPDRLKAEISRQDFIQSAQQLQSAQVPENAPVSQEQWSYLTPEERAQIMQPIDQLKREVEGLKLQNQANLQSVTRDRIDTTMRTKFQDYDPNKVDQFLSSVNSRQVTDDQLIEMSWKALNFDRYVERAHKFGLEGRSQEIIEKQNGSSYSAGTGNVVPQSEPPKREATESAPTFFKRVADWRRSHSR